MQESDMFPPNLPRIVIAPRLFGGDPDAERRGAVALLLTIVGIQNHKE
jgi:hypothetical protein